MSKFTPNLSAFMATTLFSQTVGSYLSASLPGYVIHAWRGLPTDHLGTRDDNIKGIMELYAAFPDFYATIDDLVLDVDAEKVAVRWTATGTHRGTYQGAVATGKRVLFHGIETLHISNGRIIERAGEWDEGNIRRQLGVLPEEQSQG
jgi:steroid delta-isomerase-like uncharacterized protein